MEANWSIAFYLPHPVFSAFVESHIVVCEQVKTRAWLLISYVEYVIMCIRTDTFTNAALVIT